MCPVQYGLGRKFNETYFSYFNDAIEAITNKGAYAILDPHNYMRYNDPSQQPLTGSVIGNSSDPKAAKTHQFCIFWNELAGRYVDNEKVIFGIMNEPHDMPTALVLKNDQAAINGIRASGAKQMILAPGNGYTGGHAWNQRSQGDAPSADYLYKLHDPINNTAIDIHEYLDVDFSGQHKICNQSFPENLEFLTQWLRKYQLKAMVTEFGGDNNTMCYHYLRQAVKYMAENDECKALTLASPSISTNRIACTNSQCVLDIGWAAWAAGPIWGTSSPCCTNSQPYGSLEPGSLAADGSPGLYETVWLKVIQPLVPKHLQRRGISSINGPGGV